MSGHLHPCGKSRVHATERSSCINYHHAGSAINLNVYNAGTIRLLLKGRFGESRCLQRWSERDAASGARRSQIELHVMQINDGRKITE